MPFELPADPSQERRARITRWIGTALAVILIGLVAYFAYIGYEASRQLTNSPTDSADCRTPAMLGWPYEAINYPIGTDTALSAMPDPRACSHQGARPGGEIVGAGGVRLAGWYVPAASDIGPTGPTVILAHGWSSNKSAMLDRATVLHDDYNIVIFDFRNHGQSEAGDTTQGVRESEDVRAFVDWLVTNKAPEQIVLFGVSMGGASVLAEAVGDLRVDAVIAESTHASLADAIQARLDRSGYPMSIPGSWAALLGTLVRTGEDLSSVDPVSSIARLGSRPVLIISGGHDLSIGPEDAQQLLAAAERAGVAAELDTCEPAGHAESPEACPEDYGGWVLGFLERALAGG